MGPLIDRQIHNSQVRGPLILAQPSNKIFIKLCTLPSSLGDFSSLASVFYYFLFKMGKQSFIKIQLRPQQQQVDLNMHHVIFNWRENFAIQSFKNNCLL